MPAISRVCSSVLEFWIDGNLRYPPTILASLPDPEEKWTTNGAESFHVHLNEQLYASQSNIHVFVDVLLKMQTKSCIKMITLNFKKTRSEIWKGKDGLLEQNTKLVNVECTCTTVDFGMMTFNLINIYFLLFQSTGKP